MGLNKRLISTAAAGGGVVNTENFAPVIYTGNGGTQSISSLDFQSDLIWFKSRNFEFSGIIYDSIRGSNKGLHPNSTTAEFNTTDGLASFNANGFTLSGGGYITNRSGYDYVAWCFKGGGAAVSNTDGTVTAQVSANVDSGFSISTYTGVGYPNSTTATVGHGLNSAPELVIIKKLDSTSPGNGSWVVGTEYAGSGWDGSMYLNSTNAYSNAINYFWNGDPTDSVVKLKNDWFVNGNNNNYVMYCFHSVDGYQKIGSYTGTGAAGNTVTTGFEPRFLLVKRATGGTGEWILYDSIRETTSIKQDTLAADSSRAESTNVNYEVEFESNGFSLNGTSAGINGLNDTYIYLAIA